MSIPKVATARPLDGSIKVSVHGVVVAIRGCAFLVGLVGLSKSGSWLGRSDSGVLRNYAGIQ